MENDLVELLKLYSDKFQCWGDISKNPNINWKFIQDDPDKPWFWSSISMNPNITWKIIRNNPDKPWDWFRISMNTNITWKIIQDNPDEPWNWEGISCNPNITSGIIINNSDKSWDWEYISNNTFNNKNYFAEKIQSTFKGYLARKKYNKIKTACKVIERYFTEYLYRPGKLGFKLSEEHYNTLSY